MTFNPKEYKRTWMFNHRRKGRDFTAEKCDKLVAEGKCTTCEMLLSSKHHNAEACGVQWQFRNISR